MENSTEALKNLIPQQDDPIAIRRRAWRGIKDNKSSDRAVAAWAALDRAAGAAVTSESMKHSHSQSGAARAPTAQACALPVQRAGNGGLRSRVRRPCLRVRSSTM